MVHIEFLGPMNKESLDMEASTLQDVAERLNQDDEVKAWLQTCAVAVNDMLVSSLDTPLNPGDKISLLPPVCGG